MRNQLIAEAIGTYFLYLIIGLCLGTSMPAGHTPIAVGIGLAALVYACGHISKAHFNPATTIAFYCAGTPPKRAVIPYILVIFAAAVLASMTASFFQPDAFRHASSFEFSLSRIVAAEFLFTFALMWVILNVAAAKGTAGNGFYGLAIGALVGAGAYVVGPISFAAFNPAVSLALCLDGHLPWALLPIYLNTQIFAAISAGYLFRSMQITNPSELSA